MLLKKQLSVFHLLENVQKCMDASSFSVIVRIKREICSPRFQRDRKTLIKAFTRHSYSMQKEELQMDHVYFNLKKVALWPSNQFNHKLSNITRTISIMKIASSKYKQYLHSLLLQVGIIKSVRWDCLFLSLMITSLRIIKRREKKNGRHLQEWSEISCQNNLDSRSLIYQLKTSLLIRSYCTKTRKAKLKIECTYKSLNSYYIEI